MLRHGLQINCYRYLLGIQGSAPGAGDNGAGHARVLAL